MNINIPEKLFLGKHGLRNLFITLFLAVTIPSLISGVVSFNWGVKSQIVINNNNPSPTTPDVRQSEQVKAYSNCEPKDINGFKDDWDTERYSKKGNLYCAYRLSPYLFPDLPYRNNLLYGTNGLKFSYKNLSDEGKNALALAVGNNQKDIIFYVLETNPQLIGIEVLNEESKYERISPITLKSIPKLNSEIELQIRGNVNKGNDITYILNINYISSLDSEKEEEAFPFSIKGSDTNPTSFNVYIASARGKCFQPTGYELCR